MRLLWLLIPLITQTNALLEFEVPSINHIELDIGKFDRYRPYHYENPLHSKASIAKHAMLRETEKEIMKRIAWENAHPPDEITLQHHDFAVLTDKSHFGEMTQGMAGQYVFAMENILSRNLSRAHPYSLVIDYFNEYYMLYPCGRETEVQLNGTYGDEYYVRKDWKNATIFNRFITDCEEEYTCEKFVTRPDDFQGMEIVEWQNVTLITQINHHALFVKTWRTFTICNLTYYPEFTDRLRKLGFAEDLLIRPTPAQLLALRKIAQHPLMDWRKTVKLPESRVAERDKLWADLNKRELKNYEYAYLLATGKIENPEEALKFD